MLDGCWRHLSCVRSRSSSYAGICSCGRSGPAHSEVCDESLVVAVLAPCTLHGASEAYAKREVLRGRRQEMFNFASPLRDPRDGRNGRWHHPYRLVGGMSSRHSESEIERRDAPPQPVDAPHLPSRCDHSPSGSECVLYRCTFDTCVGWWSRRRDTRSCEICAVCECSIPHSCCRGKARNAKSWRSTSPVVQRPRTARQSHPAPVHHEATVMPPKPINLWHKGSEIFHRIRTYHRPEDAGKHFRCASLCGSAHLSLHEML